MRKSRLILGAAVIVGCFEQTESADLPAAPATIPIELGHFDPACNSVSGSTTYVKEGDVCHVIVDKPALSVVDMADLRTRIANAGVDLGELTLSFHCPTGDDLAFLIDQAVLPVGGGAPQVSRWNASFGLHGMSLASVAETAVPTNALVKTAKSFQLPGPAIDELDDAWNNMKALDASFHADLFVGMSDVPAFVAGGDLKLQVTVELQGCVKTTTKGWPG